MNCNEAIAIGREWRIRGKREGERKDFRYERATSYSIEVGGEAIGGEITNAIGDYLLVKKLSECM